MNVPEIIKKIDGLSDNQRSALVKDTVEKLDQREKQELAATNVNSLTPIEKTEFVRSATKNLNTAEKQAVVEAILGSPTQKATDTLWLIIVIVFASGFILSIIAMIYAALIGNDINDKLITIFTTTSAFLAGLIAPSPMSR